MVPTLIDRVRRRLPRVRRRSPDPFLTLELQMRLGRLAMELDDLAAARVKRYALAHHAKAAMLAYEATLAEACRFVGADVPEGRGPARRLLMEATLANAGWTW